MKSGNDVLFPEKSEPNLLINLLSVFNMKNLKFKNQNVLKLSFIFLFLTVSLMQSTANILVLAPELNQQAINITGTVTDNLGESLPGVNIMVKGTLNGTITNANGTYSIQVPNNDAILVFSFVGFVSQEIAVNNRQVIDVMLVEDVSQLEEVVVVGYGTVKKANLTGAVGYIESKQLENRSVPSVSQALMGKVAGLNITTSNGAPGTTQSINLRGYTGINTDGSTRSDGPLVVIDGIQGGNLSTLEMNDVESISFLKDAASAAIYGSSAPYGVIIVTTKRGRAGKPLISYNNNIAFSQAINLPHYVNSLDFANYYNEVSRNSNYSANMYSDETIQRIIDYQAGKIKDETMASPAEGADSYYTWSGSHANNDWFKIFFKDFSFSQQHNVSASGSTESSTYYIGLGYTQYDGVYHWANDIYQRYNARVNLSTNLTKWLTFSLRSAFTRGDINTPAIYSGYSGGSNFSQDYFHQLGRTFPTHPLYFPNGEFSDLNPAIYFAKGGRNKQKTDNYILTGEFIAHPLPGWDITANYTYNGTYFESSNHRKTIYSARPSGALITQRGTDPNFFERDMRRNQIFTLNTFTSYEKTLSENHFIALVGFTQELYDNLRFYGSNTNLYSDEIPSLSMTYGTNRSSSDEASQLAIRGAFGRIAYDYKEKYLLELNGRYDGTSRFMKDKRFKFYPGISGAWVPSRESFWDPIMNYVNHFKIRASYASLGDQAFDSSYYPFYPSLNSNSPTSTSWIFGGGRESAMWQSGLVNYDLTWITVNTLGFGVDLAAFKNRLDISFDWYNRHAKDFAGPAATYPALLGTSAPRENNAETTTKGIEITVGWRDRIGEFSYGANLVLSDYQSKVLKYNNPTKLISSVWYDGATLGEIWGYETVGLFKDQAEIDATNQSYLNANWYVGDVHYADLDGDGKLGIGDNTIDNPGDRKIIGNTTPRYSFGLTLNADWKGFDAAVFLQGVGKRDMMFSTSANFFWAIGGDEWQSCYYTVHTDRWTEDNPNGYFPRQYFNTSKNRESQTRYLQSAAYMRVKNVQLGYTIPKKITDTIKFQRVRVFFNVENLATFTKLMNIIDPEIVKSDAKAYPLRRTGAFGINVTF